MYVDGPLKLPLGGKWGSSVPSKQCAITPKKNAGKVYKPGEDELNGPPVVALMHHFYSAHNEDIIRV